MPQYVASVKDYIIKVLVEKIAATREEHGMFDATVRDSEWDEDTDLSLGASGRFSDLTLKSVSHKVSDADKAVVSNKTKLTERQLHKFLDLCWTKYVKARIEPGL